MIEILENTVLSYLKYSNKNNTNNFLTTVEMIIKIITKGYIYIFMYMYLKNEKISLNSKKSIVEKLKSVHLLKTVLLFHFENIHRIFPI